MANLSIPRTYIRLCAGLYCFALFCGLVFRGPIRPSAGVGLLLCAFLCLFSFANRRGETEKQKKERRNQEIIVTMSQVGNGPTTSTSMAPPLEMLQKLQLFRSTLVNFLEWRNFSDVVHGCYVRVLLEMRSAEENRRESPDNYYIACVKGAQRGPVYSGFSADAVTTEWHIVIELPPCFRSTQNGNVVQLNSISNSPFRQAEYQNWMEMTNETPGLTFSSLPQLQFRLGMLEEHKQQALSPVPRRRRVGEDPASVALRDKSIQEKRKNIMEEMMATHVKLPRIDQLKTMQLESLQEVEREILDLITEVRVVINERSKCMMCHNRICTEICYPCKHQVLCKDCSKNIHGHCPVKGCAAPVQYTFEAYTS